MKQFFSNLAHDIADLRDLPHTALLFLLITLLWSLPFALLGFVVFYARLGFVRGLRLAEVALDLAGDAITLWRRPR